MDDNYFNTKGAILILQISSVQREIMMETPFGTISAANKHVPCTCKVNGGHVGCEMLDLIYNTSCTWGQIWLTARLKKTNECSRINVSSPTGFFIHLHIYHRASVSLPAISLVLILPSLRDMMGEGGGASKAQANFFWDAEKNEWLSLVTLSDKQCPDMAGNGYASPFLLYVTHWNDRRYGGEWWILQCSRSLRAKVEL